MSWFVLVAVSRRALAWVWVSQNRPGSKKGVHGVRRPQREERAPYPAHGAGPRSIMGPGKLEHRTFKFKFKFRTALPSIITTKTKTGEATQQEQSPASAAREEEANRLQYRIRVAIVAEASQ